MSIQDQIFIGKQVCLTPIDHEKDPEVEAKWTEDAETLQMLDLKLAMPRSAAQVRKAYEAIEKEMEEDKNLFYFAIRTIEKPDQPERLVGFIRLYWIEWSNGAGMIQLGIGSPQDRRHGYGWEALNMALTYAFNELNLFRLTAQVPEYNPAAQALFQKSGFQIEVRQRETLHRFNRRWDLYHMGILRSEWAARFSTQDNERGG